MAAGDIILPNWFTDLEAALKDEFNIELVYRKPDWAYCFIGAIKCQIHNKTKQKQLNIGHGLNPSDMELVEQTIADFNLPNNYSKKEHGNEPYINFQIDSESNLFELFLELLRLAESIKDQITSSISRIGEQQTGTTFQGTDLENCGERTASIAAFRDEETGLDKLVGTEGYKYIPEFYTDSGEIDGVWLDRETRKPIGLLEVQSSIKHGVYLDNDHATKLRDTYFLDTKVYGNIKVIVAVAGGFTEECVAKFENWAKDHPTVKVFLLKTNKKVLENNSNTIGLEVDHQFN